MKRLTRSKAATLSRQRALIRSLIEQTGLAEQPKGGEDSLGRVVESGSNIEYFSAGSEATLISPVDRTETACNIIPFPDLRAKG